MAEPNTQKSKTTPDATALSTEVLLEMIETLQKMREQRPQDDNLTALIQTLAESQKTLGEEVKRTVRRSNADHAHVSDFTYDPACESCKTGTPHRPTGDRELDDQIAVHPLAHPKHKLKHEVYFCGIRQFADELKPAEIALYNQFTVNKESREGAWTATFRKHGTKRQLLVAVPCTSHDDLVGLPPLVGILTELLYGSDVTDPSQVAATMAAMQKQIDDLKKQLAHA